MILHIFQMGDGETREEVSLALILLKGFVCLRERR
jgi:hypothetical protein